MREVAAAEIETPRLIPSIVQQRSDKGAFFRQKMFRSKIARIAARAFFVAVHSKYGSANRNGAGRFRTSCAHVAEYRREYRLARPVISFHLKVASNCSHPRLERDGKLVSDDRALCSAADQFHR